MAPRSTASDTTSSGLLSVAQQSGLTTCPKFYGDRRFIALSLAGFPVAWLFHSWVSAFSMPTQLEWTLLLSVLVWQPFIEELLFRGIIQGQLIRFDWGNKTLFNISAANAVTSMAFAGAHMVNSSVLFAMLVLLPSLIYGHFRDSYKSIYPSIVIHGLYNLYAVLLIAYF